VTSIVASEVKYAPEICALGMDYGCVLRGKTHHSSRRSDAGPPVCSPGGLGSGRLVDGRLRCRAVPAPGDFDSAHAGVGRQGEEVDVVGSEDRKSTRLNSSHGSISYAVFCLKKKTV